MNSTNEKKLLAEKSKHNNETNSQNPNQIVNHEKPEAPCNENVLKAFESLRALRGC